MTIEKSSSSISKSRGANVNLKKKSKLRKQYLQDDSPSSRDLDVNVPCIPLKQRKKRLAQVRSLVEESKDAPNKYYKGAVAIGAAVGAVAGATIGTLAYEELSSTFDKSQIIQRFFQRNIPIDQALILSQHNAGALIGGGTMPGANNQLMSIYDILTKTPVRSFDIDIWKHLGELVINHGDLYNPFISDADITKLQDTLETINNWLNQPDNSKETIFFNFENQQNLPPHLLEDIFGKHAVLTPDNFDQIFPDKCDVGTSAPTMNELSEKGIKVVVMHSDYVSAGHAVLKISDHHTMNNYWEDRSLLQYGQGLHPEVAGKITTGTVDKIASSGHGGVLSLDKISEHDPRFYTPEQRTHLGLKPDDLKIGAQTYASGKEFDATFLGLGTAAAVGSSSLSLAMGAFQAFANETTISKQDKILPSSLANIELGRVLAERQKNKDLSPLELTKLVTKEEIKAVYKKEKVFNITKSTLLPGGMATLSILSSMLAISLLFPPVAAVFWGLAAVTAGVGLIAIAIATATNRKRLGKAIDKAFEIEEVDKAVQKRINYMNSQLKNNLPSEQLAEDPEYANEYIKKLIATEKTTANLMKGLHVSTTAMLLARISSFGKYVTPFISLVSGGICAAFTAIFVIFNSIINFRERRNKLDNISKFVMENDSDDYQRKQKKKLMLFGKTALERFIYKDKENLFNMLEMPANSNFKDAFYKLMIPENEPILEKYLTSFTVNKLTKELSKLAKKQNPPLKLHEVTTDKEKLNDLLKQYMINKSCKLASRDTWKSGLKSVFSLVAIGFFCGLLLTPLVGLAVALGIGITGGTVSKLAAKRESKLFRKRMNDILAADKQNLNKADLLHRADLDGLLTNWNQMLYKAEIAKTFG